MSGEREFDLIIFGATGFTGYFMIRELLLTIEKDPSVYGHLKWAIAGRNIDKLTDTLLRLVEELKRDLSSVAKIQADVSDPESLLKMAQRTKLVLNAVGPYALYGRPVIEACITAGTHHLDISGESNYIEEAVLDFNSRARQSGSLVVSSVGWDSIPNDIGTDFLKTNFNGHIHSVESFTAILPGPAGYRFNTGTFTSAMHFTVSYLSYLRLHNRLLRETVTKAPPKSRHSHPWRLLPFTRPGVSGWNIPFIGADKPIVLRSQTYHYETTGERPLLFQPYISIPRFWYIVLMTLLLPVIAPMWLFSCGQAFVERHVEGFTRGLFSSQGPSREQMESTKFKTILVGKGWSKIEGDDPKDEPKRPFDKVMTVVVSGPDPAYLATSTLAIQSALTVLLDREKMPKGGVLTTASAFRGTKLVDRLQAREVTFKIIET